MTTFRLLCECRSRVRSVLGSVFGERAHVDQFLPRPFVFLNVQTGERRTVIAPDQTWAWRDVEAGRFVDPPLVRVSNTNEVLGPVDREEAHSNGFIHRAVHIEIVNREEEFLILRRDDGRSEEVSGHVDYLEPEQEPEDNQHAAIRELYEELELYRNWGVDINEASNRLLPHLVHHASAVNQLLGGNTLHYNNEFVEVFRLTWDGEWGDPTNYVSNAAQWLPLEKIVQLAAGGSTFMNSALQLFLHRNSAMAPRCPRT